MKKAWLLSVALLWMGWGAHAAPANATFSSEQGVPFQLIFDGQPQHQSDERVVHLDRLAPGFHWAEFLIRHTNGSVATLRARVVLDGGLENSYVLLAHPDAGVQLRKVGQVPIRRGYSVFEAMPTGLPRPTPAGRSDSGPAPYTANPAESAAAPTDSLPGTGLHAAPLQPADEKRAPTPKEVRLVPGNVMR